MIAVDIQGRLGNQLFEYAFAWYVAKRLHTFCLFDNSKQFIVPIFFQVNRFPLVVNRIPGVRTLYRKKVSVLRAKCFRDWNDCSILHNQDVLTDNTYYSGFFQSILYFEEFKDVIKQRFRIRDKYQRLFEKKYATLTRSKLCVLHVRRGDYQSFGDVLNLGGTDKTLPVSYYETCFRQIHYLSEYEVICVSDDVESCKQMFRAFPFVHFLPEKTDLITDFQLLLHADIVIISNSTFSWWAAYLNGKQGKMVFAPKYFLGFDSETEFPLGISATTGFKWIDVPAVQ